MGNSCQCVCRQTDDDARDALLEGLEDLGGQHPRGPPPPYQPLAPLYAYTHMTEEQRIQLVQRITLIQSLPCGRYDTKKGSPDHFGEKKGDKDRECPICMMDFVVGEPIRLLPCMHYYHMRCIDDWLMRALTCPTCMERVDLGVRNAALSPRTLRRRHFGSSTSMASTSSSSSTLSTRSSTTQDHLLNQYQQQQHYSPSYTHHHHHSSASGTQQHISDEFVLQQRHQTQELPNQPLAPLNIGQRTVCSSHSNNSVRSSSQSISPPESPHGGHSGGRGHVPSSSPPVCRSPPVFEYHFEFVTPAHCASDGQ